MSFLRGKWKLITRNVLFVMGIGFTLGKGVLGRGNDFQRVMSREMCKTKGKMVKIKGKGFYKGK